MSNIIKLGANCNKDLYCGYLYEGEIGEAFAYVKAHELCWHLVLVMLVHIAGCALFCLPNIDFN